MDAVDKEVDNITREILVDYEGLWAIAWYFRNNLKIESDAEVKEKTFAVIRKIMERNIMPGNLSGRGGFTFWQGTTEELLARIDAEWPKTGIPRLSYTECWFALKKEG